MEPHFISSVASHMFVKMKQKLCAKRQKGPHSSSPACATFFAELCNPIPRRAIELSKPSTAGMTNLWRMRQIWRIG